MQKKNNISGLKVESKNILANIKPKNTSSKPGPKPKPAEEKQTEIIALKMTKNQKSLIEKKSGLVPNATFLMDILEKQTNVFQ